MVKQGAEMVKRLQDWFSGYMAMPPEYALVVALWVVNTWIFRAFDATPYLVIAASTKESGKTVFLEMVAMLSKEGKVLTDPTPSTLYRMLEARQGWMTICFDEAEKLSKEGNPMRPFMNSGYRRGQTLPRTMPGGKVVDFDVYCPKAFSLIGDVYDTLRGRSIVLWLSRGIPAKKYRRSEAEREAVSLRREIEKWVSGMATARASVPIVEPIWLSGRDEEIWTPLLSLAHALELSKADLDMLTRASADLTVKKTEKAKKFQDMGDHEDAAIDDTYAVRVLRDLVSVINPDENAIPSEVAVERLKAIPSGPWRYFKGAGISAISLAAMLARYPALAEYPKPVFISKKVKPHHQRGYHAVALRRALFSVEAVKPTGEVVGGQS